MRPLRPLATYGARWGLGAAGSDAAVVVTSGMDVDSAHWFWSAGFGPPRTPPVEGDGGAGIAQLAGGIKEGGKPPFRCCPISMPPISMLQRATCMYLAGQQPALVQTASTLGMGDIR